MRVLVCGGRKYGDRKRILITLRSMHLCTPITCIIEGGADGADRHAHAAGLELGIKIETYSADWKTHGTAGGPIRNQQMIDEGKPDVVVAFPGGKGTASMVSIARKAGVKVIEVGAGDSENGDKDE